MLIRMHLRLFILTAAGEGEQYYQEEEDEKTHILVDSINLFLEGRIAILFCKPCAVMIPHVVDINDAETCSCRQKESKLTAVS